MSNRRRPRNGTLLDTIAAMIGDQRIAGGCDDCDAYQTMSQTEPGVYSVTVSHDESCPWLAAREGRAR